MNSQESKVRRVRLSVPSADESVIQWLDAQACPSHSIRCLIHDYVSSYGVDGDPTVMNLGHLALSHRGPGRPPGSKNKKRSEDLPLVAGMSPVEEAVEPSPMTVERRQLIPAQQVSVSQPVMAVPEASASDTDYTPMEGGDLLDLIQNS